MLKQNKKELVSTFKKDLEKQSIVLLMSHGKLPFSSLDAARRNAQTGTKIRKIKNNLMKFAFEGSNYENLSKYLKNENVVIMSDDLFNACKSAKFLLENNKNSVKLVSGTSDNEVYENEMILNLASVESVQELQSKLLRVIKVVGENVLRVVKAKFEEK